MEFSIFNFGTSWYIAQPRTQKSKKRVKKPLFLPQVVILMLFLHISMQVMLLYCNINQKFLWSTEDWVQQGELLNVAFRHCRLERLQQPFCWSWSRRLNVRTMTTYSSTPPTREEALSQGTLQGTLLCQALLPIGGRVALSLPRFLKQGVNNPINAVVKTLVTKIKS